MAYEGLDVPAITHVACLTNIRSKPWLEQSWARAARVDREAGDLKKQGLIYLPDDQLAAKCVQAIVAEQEPILRERELNRRDNDNGRNGNNDAKSKEPRYNSSIALSSNLTRSRASDLSTGETVDYDETAKIQSAMKKAEVGGLSTIQIKRLINAFNELEGKDGHDYLTERKEALTPSEELDLIRNTIEKYVRHHSAKNGIEYKTINGEIVKEFGKRRREMTLEELRQVWAWLQSKYPMND
ncbi:MAG: hypothetical protein HC789_23940 [Microcoleus sp. CSU_2_2]|nr:hypothetical protein [Microcoleus sp. SU_5_3]NJS13202.1 hypothetical protein [Microcoleus sp. CSU_2_2]